MTRRLAIVSASVLAMSAGVASGAAVNFGNLVVYNNPLTIIPFNAPAGGTYVKFVYTTNWSYNSGTPTSYQAAWYVGNPVNSIVASFSSISGMANNANPTTITISGTFSIGVTNANSLQFVASQNNNAIGQFAVSGNWGNTTLNFYVQKPLPPVPVGVADIGTIHVGSTHLVSIDTGGSTFGPSVGIFGEDGYLVGTNGGGTVGLPGSALTDMTLANGVYYVFVAGEGATFGPEDLEVGVPPEAPGGTLTGGVNGVPWPVSEIAPGAGQWYSFTVAPPVCAGDITGDGVTNIADFNVLAGNFGCTG